jgi:hypothetical protein
MKKLFFTAFVSSATIIASADIYNDATGDFTGGFAGLDITSLTLNNNATSLNFTIGLAGDPTAFDWHNYVVGIAKASLPVAGGNANAGGGWSKDIQMTTGGMDYFIGAYPAFNGFDLKTWNGTSWDGSTGAASWNSSSVTFSVTLASLGLAAGDTITLDLWTTSNGNTVLDALSDTTSRGFNNTAFDTGGNGLTYVVQVPEPSAAMLFLLAGAFLSRRLTSRR